MRTPYVGGNWKMNLSRAGAVSLAQSVARAVAGLAPGPRTPEVAVFPSFVHLDAVVNALCAAGSTRVRLGAQDCYHEPDGAFTGEVSVAMLKDLGATCALTGHSERRHVLLEPDSLINVKTRALLDAGMTAVLCVGETLAQREDGATDAINEQQLRAGLAGVTGAQASSLVIAYEPVWAIGTGKTATPEDAQRAHLRIRSVLVDLFGEALGASVRVIYGGSVKASNAPELIAQPDIDGFLVGGASLKAEEFGAICAAAGT